MKKYLLILLLSGCSTVVPVKQEFPTIPEELIKPCKPLETIPGDTTTLSKLMETVAKNYGSRHECASQVDSIREWHQQQKKIYDSVSK